MITKSILAALVMLVGYHFVAPRIPPKYFQSCGPQRDNYSRAQVYVHSKPPDTKVILGSSLSLRLNQSKLGPDYYKLCFGGGSIFTGLEIIRRAEKHPAVVLIEINQLYWKTDPDLLNDVFNPVRRKLRNRSIMFREPYRPANLVNGIGEIFVRKSCERVSTWLGKAPAPDISTSSSAYNPALFSRLYRMFHDQFLAVAPPDLANQANRLGEYVDALGRHGTTCIFYEMPIDSSLSGLPSPVAVRNAAETRFSRTRYHWLKTPRDHDYDTYDGLHVSQAEADRLTEEFARQLAMISQ